MNNFIATEIFENGKTHIEPFFKINRKILIFCASVCEIIPSGVLTCSSDQSAKLMRNSREAVLPTRVYHILDQKWAWMYSDDVSIQKIQKVNSFEELAELIEKKSSVIFKCLS
mgnify:CR=1 FL=1